MNELIIVAVVEPMVASIVGIVMWVVIQRRIERRDKEMDALHAELKELRDEKFNAMQSQIAGKLDAIDRRITGEAEARRELDKKVQEDFARTRDMNGTNDSIRDLFAKVNRMDKELSRGNALTELIAQHLKINFRSTTEA